MPRLLFEKTRNAVWMSHLDLMRLFQRAFKRAGLPLKHTQGFNPRPSVSIALPLSVGVASCCELLDFDLDCDYDATSSLVPRLNSALVDGITVLDAYHECGKLRDLSLMRSELDLIYDNEIPDNATVAIKDLLSRETLLVTKKTKNGPQEQDIIPMIRSISVREADNTLIIEVLHCCQNPTLNPMQICVAIQKYLPEYSPDCCKCRRVEIYNSDETIFR